MDFLVEKAQYQPTCQGLTLGGRGGVIFTNLPGIGRIVIKPYLRGGLIAKVNKRTYLKFFSKYRSVQELEILGVLKHEGIPVPEPVTSIVRGSVFYRCWIVTKEIEKASTLVQIAVAQPERIHILMEKISFYINKISKIGIYHVDLHPGNILVTNDDKIYFIDFDRAKQGMNSDVLRSAYRKRWNRAVKKYSLPQSLYL